MASITSKPFILLHSLLLLYSFAGVFSKLASQESFLSLGFIAYYGAAILLLVVYALGWQQVLKKLPLSIAFGHKGIILIWGMLWGVLFFDELIRWNMLLGAGLVFAGILLLVNENE